VIVYPGAKNHHAKHVSRNAALDLSINVRLEMRGSGWYLFSFSCAYFPFLTKWNHWKAESVLGLVELLMQHLFLVVYREERADNSLLVEPVFVGFL
jgi:hypothetical protein